ncbi:hypothetical protein ZOSMA_142G00280 [Zostera marina]|uniref:Bifunctional inhibitor/plant lipid transfer protein/seed storage helical domain-containing protein n=1 Tax=Zostera marina TaxID=29655 RepID=A0A0K9PXT6_ZOSMR|nr:hypothetical protein ZOSMA_142G00280 [Zostera marina]
MSTIFLKLLSALTLFFLLLLPSIAHTCPYCPYPISPPTSSHHHHGHHNGHHHNNGHHHHEHHHHHYVPSPHRPSYSPPIHVKPPPYMRPPHHRSPHVSPPYEKPPTTPVPYPPSYNPSPPTNLPCPSPPPPPPSSQGGTCPTDALKLSACVDVLGGLVHAIIGQSATDACCPLLIGLVDLDAAVCLCTTIRLKLLNINIVLPIALQLLIDCGKHPPSDYKCPS